LLRGTVRQRPSVRSVPFCPVTSELSRYNRE